MLEIVTIKDIKDKIGEACMMNRKANNLSCEELAKALDVSSTTIKNIENGKNTTLNNVLEVANHFDLLQKIAKELDSYTSDQNNISLY
ncbi:XRE family transcriptional regulator [Brumimicrobium salinarum]|uniref:XRE family transcriptional regulator n=1 Tax=Brumimicrobium salinarum TaxID=2058658 RepID=A0A2I0R2E1_9FLAO|nr:helix-turn-helix transcriptional regulator [Brumimicrobium salinarum]PKR80737.1 XRE family transcriptional regulator [Brumimicrobium salinarum]